MIQISKKECINELEKIATEKFHNLYARELSVSQLEELLNVKKCIAKLSQDDEIEN